MPQILKPILPVLLALAGLLPAAAQTPLRIAAAADLLPVLPPILAQFQQKTGIRAEATYKASAMLTTQILNGAPFDVFLAADTGYPQRLLAAGAADSTSPSGVAPVIYAKGTLVLWTRNDSGLPPPSLALLRNPRLQRLAIANPDRAPYGKAAVAALQKAGLYESLQPHLVIAEDIAQTAQFVDSGNAQAGLISMTSALTPRLQADGRFFVIPRDLYPPLDQGVVIVHRSTQRAAARRFVEFLLSPQVQSELATTGLAPGR
ncbi:MAG: molybdate ABC transporter substrate-binding protein [Acidobacteriota bacterium]